MELVLISSGRYVKQKVERDHYWYDHIEKSMRYGRGGRMEFRYDPQAQRWLPYLVDEFKQVYANNFVDLQSWVNRFSNEYDLTVLGQSGDRNLRVAISPLYLDEALRTLKECGIAVEYEPAEYKREMQDIKREHENRIRESQRRSEIWLS